MRLDGYDLDKLCPLHEFKIARCLLETGDIQRLFAVMDFAKYTEQSSCRLAALLPNADADGGVARFMADNVDLRRWLGLELIIVSMNAEHGPLLIIDGNHRAIAHHRLHRTIEGVAAFVCEHPRVNDWNRMPSAARVRPAFRPIKSESEARIVGHRVTTLSDDD